MTKLHCDACAATAEPTEFGVPPAGWVHLRVYQGSNSHAYDCCTLSCGVMLLRKLQAVEAIPPPTAVGRG